MTIEHEQIRRSTGADKDTREGMTAGVKYLLRSLERALGMEDATKKRHVQDNPWPNESMSLRKRCWT